MLEAQPGNVKRAFWAPRSLDPPTFPVGFRPPAPNFRSVLLGVGTRLLSDFEKSRTDRHLYNEAYKNVERFTPSCY